MNRTQLEAMTIPAIKAFIADNYAHQHIPSKMLKADWVIYALSVIAERGRPEFQNIDAEVVGVTTMAHEAFPEDAELSAAMDEINYRVVIAEGVCPVTNETECKSRDCELHYMDAPLNFAPDSGMAHLNGTLPGTDEIAEIVEAVEIAYQEHKNVCGGCVKCLGFMTNISRRKAYNKQTGRSVHTRGYYQGTFEIHDERRYFSGQFTPAQRRRMAKKARKHAVDANGMTNGNSYAMHWHNSESVITCS